MKQIYSFCLIILFIFLSTKFSFSQNYQVIDSLENVLTTEIDDSTRIITLLYLSDHYRYFDKENAFQSVNQAFDLSQKTGNARMLAWSHDQLGFIQKIYNDYENAIKNLQTSIQIFTELKIDSFKLTYSYVNLGESYQQIGDYDSAHYYYNLSLELGKQLDYTYVIAHAYHMLGGLKWLEGDFLSATEYYEKTLPILEALEDISGKAYTYNNMAILYFEMEKYDQALEIYMDALAVFNDLGDNYGRAIVYLNAGEIHWKQKNYDTAIIYNNKSLSIAESVHDKTIIAYCYTNLGIVYFELKKFDLADYNYQEAMKIWEETGNKTGLIYCLNYIGILEFELGKYQSAIKTTERCLDISIEIGSLDEIRRANETLSKAYSRVGRYDKAYQHHVEFKLYEDSIFNKETSQKFTSLEHKFEMEKQQHLITMQETQLELQTAKLKQQDTFQKLMIAMFAAILIVVGLITYAYVQKRRDNKKIVKQKEALQYANTQLEQQKEEIEAQKDEIETQRDEIEVQRDMVMEQKEEIEKINVEITDSIHYAKYIQSAILPQQELRDKLLHDHFVLFKPRNIVSGDFYWTTEVEGQTIIAVADCTGHGVPGAFMSMLGLSFLNDIVNKEYITHPGVILRRLRKEVINALQQKGKAGEQRDGMDIALVSINYQTLELQFSGANNPLYIVRKKEHAPITCERTLEVEDYILYEIKGDKMPIALYEKMDKFQMIEIQLLKDDLIYMLSDGYPDQFGGKDGKKFKYKPFKKLLINHCDKQMAEQYHVFEQTLVDWMDGYEQVDDILVVGMKI